MLEFEKICDDSKYRFVYLINNYTNGNIYIGQHTTVNLKDGYFGSGKNLKRAIKKYGKENFQFGYLGFVSSKEELDEQEKQWIEFFKNHPTRGCYNIANGGHNWQTKEIINKFTETRKRKFESGELVIWNKGKHGIYSEEHLKKMSECRKGIPQTIEANEKRRKTQTGVKRPKEVIDKIQKTKKENPKIYTEEERERTRQQMLTFNKENKVECPWCHKKTSPMNAKYWHFDNCKHNPNCKKEIVICPWCNKSGVKGAIMNRWHFDNCKHKYEK